MRRQRAWFLFLCVVGVFSAAPHAFGQPSGKTKITAAVTYVTPGTIYIGAGSKAGLQSGDTLTVLHGGITAGQVVITAVSSTSCAASVQGPAASVAVGDSVYILKAIELVPPPAAASRPTSSVRGVESARGLMRAL